MEDPAVNQPANRDANADVLASWPLNDLPDEPALFRAVPTTDYGLGEHGTAIFTGCKLVPDDRYNRGVGTLDDWLTQFGPEVRLVMPREGIVAGERYRLLVNFVGRDDDDESLDSYEFQFVPHVEAES